jgi:hypothetical protein
VLSRKLYHNQSSFGSESRGPRACLYCIRRDLAEAGSKHRTGTDFDSLLLSEGGDLVGTAARDV